MTYIGSIIHIIHIRHRTVHEQTSIVVVIRLMGFSTQFTTEFQPM
jgi:hypothetical protein